MFVSAFARGAISVVRNEPVLHVHASGEILGLHPDPGCFDNEHYVDV